LPLNHPAAAAVMLLQRELELPGELDTGLLQLAMNCSWPA
jgi:hypothetical protein